MNRELLDELLGEVRSRFYAEAAARTFFAQRRGLIKAITWPAAWLKRHGFTSEVTPASYRRLITTVLDEVVAHGKAQFAASHYFPAYLLKCMQEHCLRHTEAVLYDFKLLRNRVDFASLVDALREAPRRGEESQASPVDAFAEAHRLLALPRRKALGIGRARPETDAQLALL